MGGGKSWGLATRRPLPAPWRRPTRRADAQLAGGPIPFAAAVARPQCTAGAGGGCGERGGHAARRTPSLLLARRGTGAAWDVSSGHGAGVVRTLLSGPTSAPASDGSESDAAAAGVLEPKRCSLLAPAAWRAAHEMQVDGEAPPDPFQTFEQTGFPPELLATV